MPIDYSPIVPYVIAVLAVLLIYRRLRRNFGSQPLRPVRMWIRIGILVLLAGSLLPAALGSAVSLLADLAGLIAGVALGVWGARRTRYERRDAKIYYIPHTYSGIAVSLLLVGRLVYRMAVLYSLNRGAATGAETLQDLGSPKMFQSPTTAGLLFVVIGYYVCYLGWVLWKSTRIGPEDLEISSIPIAAHPKGSGDGSPGR
jgi:asparagine N-glycosylation enzyme membrane subunit Stt3